MLPWGHVPTPGQPGMPREAGWVAHRHGTGLASAHSRAQEQPAAVIPPPNNAALAHIFFIPVEGTVSADDLCHTPALSGM